MNICFQIIYYYPSVITVKNLSAIIFLDQPPPSKLLVPNIMTKTTKCLKHSFHIRVKTKGTRIN